MLLSLIHKLQVYFMIYLEIFRLISCTKTSRGSMFQHTNDDTFFWIFSVGIRHFYKIIWDELLWKYCDKPNIYFADC